MREGFIIIDGLVCFDKEIPLILLFMGSLGFVRLEVTVLWTAPLVRED